MSSKMYLAGKVSRWHTEPRVPPQTIADHCHGVLSLLMLNCPPEEINGHLVFAAMFHDHGEKFVGDVRSPAKAKSPSLKEELDKAEKQAMGEHLGMSMPELTERENLWLKWADRFESLMYLNAMAPPGAIDENEHKTLAAECDQMAMKLGILEGELQ